MHVDAHTNSCQSIYPDKYVFRDILYDLYDLFKVSAPQNDITRVKILDFKIQLRKLRVTSRRPRWQ